MKINKYIAVLVLAMVGLLTSCNDLMNPTSLSNFDTKYVFSTTDDTKKAVLGVYALFAQDPYTSRMSSVWMQNTDVEVSAPSVAASTGDRRDIWTLRGGMLKNFSDIKSAWDNNYLAIERANQCIEGIQSSALANNADMKMLLGESYCLRAYRYFLLCNFWGDVPYFREAAKTGMALDIPKTDKNIIYSGMIQDLVKCEGDMYFASQFSDGIERMNREFALGMICRLSLFRAGYAMTKSGEMKRADDYMNLQNDSLVVKYSIDGVEKTARTSADYYQLAKDYAQKLIALKDRELTDYATVFMNENKWLKPTNNDVLYEVAFGSTNGGGDVGWCIGVPVTSTPTNPSSWGTTTVQVGYTPTYYYSFDGKDKRRDVAISRISYEGDNNPLASSITGLSVGKWNRQLLPASPGAASSKGTGINWPVMRYADVLLMLAEAENELNGPTDLAKSMLKRVRNRAFDAASRSQKVEAYVDSVSGGKEAFFNALVNERAWEFGGEGLRKFDLIRWNIYGKKINEVRTALINMGKATQEIELDNPEVAKYANYARKIYYAKVNNKIIFLNDYFEPTTDVVNGWMTTYGTVNSFSWCTNLYKKVTATDGTVSYTSDYANNCWIGYTDLTGVSAVPYLLTISDLTVQTSIYLKNDGYGLVFN